MDRTFYSHGACQEVTGSKHFLRIDGHLLQVDCGCFQGRRAEAYQKNSSLPFDPGAVESLILTHAHYDHCGALPISVGKGFDGNIFSTSATRDVANIVLLDSAKIQQKDYEYIQEKIGKHPERQLTAYPPLYDADGVVRAMEQFVTLNYHRPFTPIPGVTARFFDAGHIIGSATVHLTLEGGTAIAFSGDLGRAGLPIIRDPEILPPFDYLVLEGTYGNRKHKSIGFAREELASLIRKAHDRGGKIVIPAFSVERTQELIYLIHSLNQDKVIPELPIFIDSPMAVDATAIFKVHPECFDRELIERFLNSHIDPFGFNGIHYVQTVQESMEINGRSGPAVIISASGMAENGRILHHLANQIGKPENIVAIVGFMAENTLGRRIVERDPVIKIFGKPFEVRAEIATLNAFSGHADFEETIGWLKRHDLSRLKRIYLVHGEPEALTGLQEQLATAGIGPAEIVTAGSDYPLN